LILKIIAVFLFAGLVGCALMAQEAPAAQSEPPPATPQDRPQKEPREHYRGLGMRGGHHGPGAHAGDWLRKYQNLPPDQQEQALTNDAEFQKLPPERQAKLRQRLREFNAMTPEQRQRVLDRMETFEHLTPEQQERARALFARFRNLPEARRQMVKRALRNLREMDPQQRSQVLGSEKFRSMFSADEMEVLKGMSEIAPPHAPEGPANREPAPPPTDRQ
jgi:uncharacterized membrane protein